MVIQLLITTLYRLFYCLSYLFNDDSNDLGAFYYIHIARYTALSRFFLYKKKQII